MRRLILWIVSILVTFSLGVGTDRFIRQFTETSITARANVEPIALNVDQPLKEAPAVIVATPAAVTQSIPNLILDYDPDKFSPYGLFYIIGGTPDGFLDFDSLALGLNNFEDSYPGYIEVYARLTDGDMDSARAKFALVTERRLYFTTSPSRTAEFEYRFEGEFLVNDLESAKETQKPVLHGTLTKSKYGRTIAERTVTFRVEHLGC